MDAGRQGQGQGQARWGGRGPSVALGVWFGALCVGPWLLRLAHPSLYADDVSRLALLETIPLRRLLPLALNEHFAPLFHAVSWLAWQLAARRLVLAPLTFTLASYLPFVLVLPALFALLRHELRSAAAALAGVAVFSVTPIAAETVVWFSASSFMWALLGALLAWLCAARASAPSAHAGRWAAAGAVCALLAPMFSGLGLLAGPLGALRLVAGQPRSRAAWIRAIVLAGGLVGFLAVGLPFRYGAVLAASPAPRANVGAVLSAEAEAILGLLGPGLVGLGNEHPGLSPAVAIGGLGVVVALGLLWAARSPARAVIVVSLAMIVLSYGLVYPARLAQFGPRLLQVQRYHLFAQMGLACLVAAALRRPLARLDARPERSLAAACGLALVLLAIHQAPLRERMRFLRFPEQARVLRALDRLHAVCLRQGITREQALASFDPVQTRWFPIEANALAMLPACAPRPRVPLADVRAVLRRELTGVDIEALCGGMEAAPHLVPASVFASRQAVGQARLVSQLGMRPAPAPGQFVPVRQPAYLEFRIEPTQNGPARALVVPASAAGAAFEVWWTGDNQPWTELRSLRWQARPVDEAEAPGGWALPLEAVPHWNPAQAPRLRLIFRTAANLPVGAPRLVR